MEGITYQIISAEGPNVLVRYSYCGHTVDVGMDIPEDATEEMIEETISSLAPVAEFRRLTTPKDALKGLVGKSGTVSPADTPKVGPNFANTLDKKSRIVTFEDL